MAYDKSDMKARGRARVTRWVVLAAVLVASTVLGLVHRYAPELRSAGVDALCPFGGLESLWSLVAQGTYVQRISASALVLLAGTLVTAVVFGRSFCGQICPLGAIQEAFARIGGKLFRKRPVMPAVLDRPARYLKYVVLAVFTVWTWRVGELVIRPYDPWAAYHHLTSPELLTEFAVGLAVLGVSVAGSVVYDRFFCKYACPMGALLGPIGRVSWLKVRRNESSCIDCKACDKACPVNIAVSAVPEVRSAECLACGECVNACPVADTLEFSAPKRVRKVPAIAVTLGTLAIFVVLVGATTLTGDFEWVKPSLADQVEKGGGNGDGEEAAPSSGAFDTSLIKGYMSLAEVADASGVPLEDLRAEFGVSEADAARPMKEVAESAGWSVEEVRTFVGERTAP